MVLPSDVKTKSAPLSSQQEAWVEKAFTQLDESRIVQLLTDMVNIPSPTGYEGPLAKATVEEMRKAGLEAEYQEMDEDRGNAVGRLAGSGSGPELLLYSHFDHYVSGAEDDGLVFGDLDLPDMHTRAVQVGRIIHGAGAGNPKAGSAVALHAAEVIRQAGIPLLGSVTVGIVSGGIHRTKVIGGRPYLDKRHVGMGVGCEHMLRNGVTPDYAVSSKVGYAVGWEEPGMLWVKLTVKGVVGYVARRGVFKSAIMEAGGLMAELGDWFEEYAQRTTSGQVATPCHIGAIEGGWPFKPDFSPSVCNLYLDIRVSPRNSIEEVKAMFQEFVGDARSRHPELDIAWEPYLEVGGNNTSHDNWIVQSSMRAWERVEGKAHVARAGIAGATDASVLRPWGIPTARLGQERENAPVDPSLGFLAGEGADIDVMMRLARCYIYTIIDTCTRSKEELLVG